MPNRWFTTEDGYTRQALAQAARDHLYSAEALFEKGPFCFDSAGYLSHLAIELLLKAILLDSAARFPRSHDLPELVRLVRQSREQLSLEQVLEKTLEKINRLGALRYPDPRDPVEIGTEDWVLIQKLFWVLVEGHPPLHEDLESRFTDEGVIEKGGRVLMYKKSDGCNGE